MTHLWVEMGQASSLVTCYPKIIFNQPHRKCALSTLLRKSNLEPIVIQILSRSCLPKGVPLSIMILVLNVDHHGIQVL